MSNKQIMRRAGRKIRRALDNYVAELEAALAEGVLLNCDRVTTEVIDDEIIETVQPDPNTIHFVSPEHLKGLRLTLRVTETLEESELDGEVDTGETA